MILILSGTQIYNRRIKLWCTSFNIPRRVRRHVCLVDCSYIKDTIFVVSIFHRWFVSMYCLTTLKELCCQCVMGYFNFLPERKRSKMACLTTQRRSLQSIQRVSPALPILPHVFCTSRGVSCLGLYKTPINLNILVNIIGLGSTEKNFHSSCHSHVV